jgi:CRP-like cAMP-binding protein
MFESYYEDHQTEQIEIKKGRTLHKPGKLATKAYYVKSGLLRSYIIDKKGKVHIFMFAPEGWIIADIESHALSLPSRFYIDAIEDSEVIQINEMNIEAFASSDKNHAMIIRKLFKRIAVLQNRVILLMSATARQRYEYFMDTYPLLINRVSLKMIASYLGMTPEALSNIRSKIKNHTN